jgi:hypothetical protein
MRRTILRLCYSSVIAAFSIALFSGCGSGDYESKLEKRISELKTGSKFNILSAPMNVSGTSVSVRVPQEFGPSPLTEGAIVEGKAVDQQRLKPMVVELPDLKMTFEGFIPDRVEGKIPYYLYVSVYSGANKANIIRSLQGELSSKFPDAGALSDVQAPTPEGRISTWKKCRGTGNQIFYYVKPPVNGAPGEGVPTQMPGLLELWLHEENDILVVLAWRMPTGIDSNIDLKLKSEMTAGCVKVNQN